MIKIRPTVVTYNKWPLPTLPAMTGRVVFQDLWDPVAGMLPGTWTRLSPTYTSPNVWDVYYPNTNWDGFLQAVQILEVLELNMDGVTSAASLFSHNMYMTSAKLYETSSLTNCNSMFNECQALTTIYPFDVSSVEHCAFMYAYCYNVESGIYTMYNNLVKSKATSSMSHQGAFQHCGEYTQTGAAELALVPSGWK